MQTNDLVKGISQKFEQSRIVFWHDVDQHFKDELDSIQSHTSLPSGVALIQVDQVSLLALKRRIELDDPDCPFLLYFTSPEPQPESDWLLDIRLYSEHFYADRSSMLLTELGIHTMSLRPHIQSRQAFFGNKQRLAALKKWVVEEESELSLDRKMIAVVVKSDSASTTDILLSLLREFALQLSESVDDVQSDTTTPAASYSSALLTQLEKFNLLNSFWSLLANEFGFHSGDEVPAFDTLVRTLFCTDLYSHIAHADRSWLHNNILPTSSGRSTALAFLSSWRDSRSYSEYYDAIAVYLSKQLEIKANIQSYTALSLEECETFPDIEQAVIRGLVFGVINRSDMLEPAVFERVISRRLAGHWTHTSTNLGDAYASIYEGLRNAQTLFALRERFVDGFHYDSALSLYQAYETELYRFDQAYRLFNEHVYAVQSKGADILRELDQAVEQLYSNWFLYELGLAWDRLLDQENKLENWRFPSVPNQYQFYKNEVQTRLEETQAKRIFVVISDALRYEIAHELKDSIESEKRFKASLKSQLGVLPSYTQLGMAALLPHKTVHYAPISEPHSANDESSAVHNTLGENLLSNSSLNSSPSSNSTVYVDGLSTQGLTARDAILKRHNGMAVSAKALMSWTNQEGRDQVKDAEVVYIYHDTIDAIGDVAKTEEKTFEACRDTVNELKDLVSRIINRLNASQVLITADHGFLFQQQAMEQNNRTKLQTSKYNTMEAKKRYILGADLPSDEGYWKGAISNTAQQVQDPTKDAEFLLPKGTQRFHFVGGARFVHGGAMLQEICVPVLHVRELQKQQAAQHEKQPVGVVAATQPIKLVNNIDKVQFIQTDAVGGQFIPRQLELVIVDQHGNEVSSRETVLFDSQGKTIDERKRVARFKLIGSNFNRNANYKLILENAATKTRYSEYSVTIDLAIQDDFF